MVPGALHADHWFGAHGEGACACARGVIDTPHAFAETLKNGEGTDTPAQKLEGCWMGAKRSGRGPEAGAGGASPSPLIPHIFMPRKEMQQHVQDALRAYGLLLSLQCMPVPPLARAGSGAGAPQRAVHAGQYSTAESAGIWRRVVAATRA